MKILVACLGLAAAAYAQDASKSDPHPLIQGVILEAGTNRGLPGAQILINQEGSQAVRSTTSDSQGAFRFEPDQFGHFDVKVKMDGYTAMMNSPIAPIPPMTGSLQTHVVITTGNPTENLRWVLVHPGELTGRVVDAETGKPLAKISVAAASTNYFNGRRSAPQIGRVMTDGDGQFVLTPIIPGNYVVATFPRTIGQEQFQTRFSDDDLKVVDQDYERSFWPGGVDFDAASPVLVGPGASINVGTLKLRKTLYYRVHAVFPAGNCSSGEMVQVMVDAGASKGSAPPNVFLNSQVPCGQDFLIRNLQTGSYRLTLSSGRSPETHAQGSAPFDLIDRNAEVTVSLARGMDLDGRIVAAEGASPPPLDQLLVWVQPVDLGIASGRPLTPDEQGKFHVVNAALGRQHLSLVNLGRHYIKEVRYNGLPVAEGTFVVDGSPGRLEVILDDKPAAIGGVVEADGNPVSKPYVVLTSWPLPSDGMLSSLKKASGNDNGIFRFGGLPPGDYRIVAVAPEVKGKLDEPGVLGRLLSGADTVTLSPGGFEDLDLKPADPSH
jgi:hypothetical protein